MNSLELDSPCKVNVLLNILGRRPDGFHELETVLHPVPVCDRLTLERAASGVDLTCNLPDLPVDGRNLVHRAATLFREAVGLTDGIRIRLEKHVPLAAGLGGGSGNAALTLAGMNTLFGMPLDTATVTRLAARLGSDVPFFLHAQPGLATGRGEQIEPLCNLHALEGAWILLVHPGFGIATAWAYQSLGRFPGALQGLAGRARELVEVLRRGDLREAGTRFYNTLELPALEKYPVLRLYQDGLREWGACAALMSGSGSATFALFDHEATAETARERFLARFGSTPWTALVKLKTSPSDPTPPGAR